MELLEIFEKALEALKEKEFLGMCSALLYATHPKDFGNVSYASKNPDWVKALAYLTANRPTWLLHSEFYRLPNYRPNGAYWWDYNRDKGWDKALNIKIRVEFLEKLITQLKNEQNETAKDI